MEDEIVEDQNGIEMVIDDSGATDRITWTMIYLPFHDPPAPEHRAV